MQIYRYRHYHLRRRRFISELVNQSINQSISLSIYLSIYLSVYLIFRQDGPYKVIYLFVKQSKQCSELELWLDNIHQSCSISESVRNVGYRNKGYSVIDGSVACLYVISVTLVHSAETGRRYEMHWTGTHA